MQFTGMDINSVVTLAALVGLAITILYVLKLRKRRVEVPFSPLWQMVLTEQKKSNDLWQRLRRILSWLLYLVIAGLLSFSLLDPHWGTESLDGRHLVLLVDNSASMGATDVSGAVDRLDLAKRKAREVVSGLGPQDRAMLVTFNDQVRPLSPFVAETSILEPLISGIQVSATGTSYDEALRFAQNAVEGRENAEILLFSDGAGPDLTQEFEGNLRHVKIGETVGNLAVTAFNVRRYISNKLDFELFVGVRNYFERPIEAEIEIWADGALVDTKPVEIPAQDVYQGYYPSQAVSGEKLEARVRLKSRDARDILPLDDRAYALLPPIRKTSVLLVTDGNLYLEGPLLLNPNLDVTQVTPEAYNPEARYDVVVFDRVAPPQGVSRNYFYLSPTGENSPWQITRTVNDPIIERISKGNPLLRWITLTDVNIGQADQWRTTNEDTIIAASESGVPILVSRVSEGKQLLGLSFDVRNSDLPLRVAFPVLLINAIDWFMGDDGTLVEGYKTGETWAVETSAEGTVVVLGPQGVKIDAPVFERRATFYGEVPGFYELQDPAKQTIAANLANFEESAIAPKELTPERQDGLDNLSREKSMDPWIWLVLAALALLLVEWFTYNRRMTV